ncbi:hypothetical protein ACSVGI_28435 [Klebsiella pneumoniae]|uniref:hypothetical protein n=1 Tax=Klebsiella pneumoniae TaxID=573 RepID=UPI003F5E0E0D
MNNKRTITTREQIKINGEIRERTATHIVTGAHGYETLCISGYIDEHNEMDEVIHNSEELAEELLTVNCVTIRVIWFLSVTQIYEHTRLGVVKYVVF